MTTQVKFLYHEANQDIFAYFPFETWCNYTKTSFTLLEGHGPTHPFYAMECREATRQEAQETKIALMQMGYKLNILNKWEEKEPTELEEQINELYWSFK